MYTSQAHTNDVSVMSAIPELVAFDTGNEVVLATSSNGVGSIDVSQLIPTTGRLAIYFDGVGVGRMTNDE